MKLLTHNVYWFQGKPSRWGSERVAEAPEVLAALAKLYAAESVDVLCLQEVHRSDLAQHLARELGMASWLHAPGGRLPDYGGAVLSRSEALLRDRTTGENRVPHERVHIRASLAYRGERLELAVVHLPSDRYAGSGDAGHLARVNELTQVLAASPRPNIVAGDMNGKPDSPPCRLLREAGYVDAAVATRDPSLQGKRVDYIWLDETYAGRLVRFAQLDRGDFCRTSPDGNAWNLSDHPPLLVELR